MPIHCSLESGHWKINILAENNYIPMSILQRKFNAVYHKLRTFSILLACNLVKPQTCSEVMHGTKEN